jgi:hypothetical protein
MRLLLSTYGPEEPERSSYEKKRAEEKDDPAK